MAEAVLSPADHRKLAVDLFNFVWTLIDKPDRSREEDDEMIHAAHASRWHWGVVGTAVNLSRGEWQISRVYAVLGRGEAALRHALRSLEICEEHGIRDFDRAGHKGAMSTAPRSVGLANWTAGFGRARIEKSTAPLPMRKAGRLTCPSGS